MKEREPHGPPLASAFTPSEENVPCQYNRCLPVPWEDFKASPNANLLVLDTTKDTMNAAPQVSHNEFTTNGHFEQESQKVDAYWKAHLSDKGNE